jgi:hypothetical protein
MRRYVAGKHAGDGAQEDPETREWVFGLLATPRFRRRIQQLEQLDLRRRPGCEPCLRAVVVDGWTPDALYHLGWCESCRAAAIALGMHSGAAATATWYRRRAVWVAVAAVAAIAAPLVGSQVVSNRDSQVARGGSASDVGSSRSPSTTGTTDTTATGGTQVTLVPRSRPSRAVGHAPGAKASRGAHKVLPLTT